MSNNQIIPEVVAELLADLKPVLTAFHIDFYLVGAIARDINLSANPNAKSLRGTKDVDLAIRINDEGQYNALKAALVATGNFEAHPTEAIKMFYKKRLELDLLPFGEIEGLDREVKLKDPVLVLNMPGLNEIYAFVNDVGLESGKSVKVCSMEGLVLLKLIAHDDRSHRTKDISDIEHIIESYFELNDDDIYENYNDILRVYDDKDGDYIRLVCARLIGRKINMILKRSPELRERVVSILSKRQTARWQAMLDGMGDKG